MKKKIFLGLLLFLTPLLVSAKQCSIVTGSGRNIGDEIACGDEHFYVFDVEGENVRLLAKYNLYAGIIINDAKLDNLMTSYDEATEYCNSLGPDYVKMEWFSGTTYYYCISFSQIDTDIIKQDSRAISAHGTVSGEPEFPEVGDVSSSEIRAYDNQPNINGYQDEYYYDGTNGFEILLDSYAYYLNNEGFSVNGISVLQVSDIYYLNEKVNGTTMNLKGWAENVQDTTSPWPTYGYHYVFGSLKDYFSDDYSWLWGTTYWLNTKDGSNNTFFVDTLAELCSAGTCPAGLGAGVRPVINMNISNIEEVFEVTSGDEQGILLTNNYYPPGEWVTFKVRQKEGYELDRIVIVDASGNELDYRVTGNTDEYEFRMPNGNVTITPHYKEKEIINPKTGLLLEMIVFVGLIALVPIIGKRNKKQIQEIEEA